MSCSDKSCTPLSDESCHENICNVCFEPLGKTNCTTTPCGHEFCFKCIIKSYQHNPICPCCRSPFNETQPEPLEAQQQQQQDPLEDEEDIELHWRRGRFDIEDPDCYCYPAIVETIEDFDWVMRVISGGYTAHDRIRTMIKLIEPSYKFGEGEENHWEDECADNESETAKVVFDIYKRTQLIKLFAEKHIENQHAK